LLQRWSSGSLGYVGVPHGVTLDGTDLFFRHVRLLGGPAPVRRYLPELIDTKLSACTREWSWLWDVRATHRGCVPKQAFVDHWRGASDLPAGTPPIQLSERNAWIQLEAGRGELADNLLGSQEALRLAGELGEDEGLTRHRFS